MKLIISLLLSLLLFVAPIHAYADTPQTGGDIEVTMTIDPNQTPIAHRQSILSFSFNDQQHKFRGETCNCSIVIRKDGQMIFAQQLFHNYGSSYLIQSTVYYTFPEEGSYQITITGSPLLKNSFQAFNIIYTIQVKKAVQTEMFPKKITTTNTQFEKRIIDIVVGALGLGAIVLLIGALRTIKKQTL